MKIEKGYYIPNIDELHVGFELQWDDGNGWLTIELELDNFKANIENLLEDINDGRIRVKYLDKDDIKDLDYNFYAENAASKYKANESYIEIILSGLTKNIEIYITDNTGYTTCKFNGKIKNKTELKRILRQISE